MRAASLEKLMAELSKLYVRTARRAEGDQDRETLVKLYAVELSKLPGDLALAQIAAYRGTFFPALDELRVPIERSDRLKTRKQKLEALRRAVDGDNPQTERIISDEERAVIAERFRRLSASLRPPQENPFPPDVLERLAEIDRMHGDAAKAKGWKPLGELSQHLRGAA